LPPPEALEACRGANQGDACSIRSPRGDTIQGVCQQPPLQQVLACVPAGGPPAGGAP
jgi:hypothetical protein